MKTERIKIYALISVSISLLVLQGCAAGRCQTWEIDNSYPGTEIHGMVICKGLVKGYDKNNDDMIYNEVARLLAESGGRYKDCQIMRNSLIISTRNDQLFLKIDCSR